MADPILLLAQEIRARRAEENAEERDLRRLAISTNRYLTTRKDTKEWRDDQTEIADKRFQTRRQDLKDRWKIEDDRDKKILDAKLEREAEWRKENKEWAETKYEQKLGDDAFLNSLGVILGEFEKSQTTYKDNPTTANFDDMKEIAIRMNSFVGSKYTESPYLIDDIPVTPDWGLQQVDATQKAVIQNINFGVSVDRYKRDINRELQGAPNRLDALDNLVDVAKNNFQNTVNAIGSDEALAKLTTLTDLIENTKLYNTLEGLDKDKKVPGIQLDPENYGVGKIEQAEALLAQSRVMSPANFKVKYDEFMNKLPGSQAQWENISLRQQKAELSAIVQAGVEERKEKKRTKEATQEWIKSEEYLNTYTLGGAIDLDETKLSQASIYRKMTGIAVHLHQMGQTGQIRQNFIAPGPRIFLDSNDEIYVQGGSQREDQERNPKTGQLEVPHINKKGERIMLPIWRPVDYFDMMRSKNPSLLNAMMFQSGRSELSRMDTAIDDFEDRGTGQIIHAIETKLKDDYDFIKGTTGKGWFTDTKNQGKFLYNLRSTIETEEANLGFTKSKKDVGIDENFRVTLHQWERNRKSLESIIETIKVGIPIFGGWTEIALDDKVVSFLDTNEKKPIPDVWGALNHLQAEKNRLSAEDELGSKIALDSVEWVLMQYMKLWNIAGVIPFIGNEQSARNWMDVDNNRDVEGEALRSMMEDTGE